MESSLFNLNPLKITKLFKGSFSNQLYKQLLNSQIDLVLIFKPEKYYFSLKEFKNLGIPTIATTTNPFLVPLIEYPVYLNAESYFLTYFLLNIYSKCIIVNKLFSLS
jgi:ribosomal protein S2